MDPPPLDHSRAVRRAAAPRPARPSRAEGLGRRGGAAALRARCSRRRACRSTTRAYLSFIPAAPTEAATICSTSSSVRRASTAALARGRRRGLRREPGAALARRPRRPAPTAPAARSCPADPSPTSRRSPSPAPLARRATGPRRRGGPSCCSRPARTRRTSAALALLDLRSRAGRGRRRRPDDRRHAAAPRSTRSRRRPRARCAPSSPPPGSPTPARSTTWPPRPMPPRELDAWFHVDGAYGGAALCSHRRARDRFAGIERADSLTIDPHKWLFAPYDCAAIIYRDPSLARRTLHPARRLPRRAHRPARTGRPATTPPT